MRTWILAILALAIPATGCTRNAATFYEEYHRLDCRLRQKCYKLVFNAGYDNLADCRDDRTDNCSPDEFEDACSGYDEDEAKDCLAERRKQIRTCEVDENDDDCTPARICGEEADLLSVAGCLAGIGGGGDGDGLPPDTGTGLSEPWLPELGEIAANEEAPDDPDEHE